MGGAQKSDGPRDNTFCVDTFPIPFPPLTGKKQSRQRMLGATETRCIGNRFDLESFCVRLGRGVGCRVLKGFFLLLCTPCFYASVSFPPSNFPAFPPVHSDFPPSSRQKMCLAWTSFFYNGSQITWPGCVLCTCLLLACCDLCCRSAVLAPVDCVKLDI